MNNSAQPVDVRRASSSVCDFQEKLTRRKAGRYVVVRKEAHALLVRDGLADVLDDRLQTRSPAVADRPAGFLQGQHIPLPISAAVTQLVTATPGQSALPGSFQSLAILRSDLLDEGSGVGIA